MVRAFLALRAVDGSARAKVARPRTYQELLQRASECCLGGAPVAKVTDKDGDEIFEADYTTIIEDGDELFFMPGPPAAAPDAPPAAAPTVDTPHAAVTSAAAPPGSATQHTAPSGIAAPSGGPATPQRARSRRRFQRPFNKINPPTKHARSLQSPPDGQSDRQDAPAAAAAPAGSVQAPRWWTAGMDERMAEVFFLTDRDTCPVPNYYNDRLAFGSIECEVRFPGVTKAQFLTEAAHYIDEQIEVGGSILAHWKKLKARTAKVMPPSTPTPKRRPNIRANGKVWVEEDNPIFTSEDGTLISS